MNGTSGNSSSVKWATDYVQYEERLETYIVPVLFLMIFLIGVLGNGSLVLIFIRHRALRNVPNTYIFSLALADLLLIVTKVPFISFIYTFESWPWGVSICKISESVGVISTGVSVFTLTALSAERYYAIVNPLKKLQNKPVTVISAVIIWLIACSLAIPDAINSRLVDVGIQRNISIIYCSPFPSEEYAKFETVVKSLIFYIIPLIIIACFYLLMAIRLHHSANEMPKCIRGSQSIVQAKARRHVAKMVLIFVFLFFICFLPHHVFMLWFHLYPTAQEEYNEWWHVLKIVGFCLSFLNSCVNPIALFCVSRVFRDHFKHYLCCHQPRWPRNTTSTANRETSFSSTHKRHTEVFSLSQKKFKSEDENNFIK
ncbi:neuropeptide CCHamide-2 receptor [Leptinotarsa decemlineata]|uniref:neuropeptide CCHamide-2 receptor n=1 Tax=Leptinotarsa decemlineata TaxID=7539 RepID=UPI003D30D3B5